MKYRYVFIFFSALLFSCGGSDDNDPEIVCDFIEPISSNLFIELVNTQGENLIENGTYIPDDITIEFDGRIFAEVVFTEVQGIDTFVAVRIFGQDGNNTFEINLSDTVTDTLVLNLTESQTSEPCSQQVFRLNAAIYNDESKEIQDFGGDFLITVVKE